MLKLILVLLLVHYADTGADNKAKSGVYFVAHVVAVQ